MRKKLIAAICICLVLCMSACSRSREEQSISSSEKQVSESKLQDVQSDVAEDSKIVEDSARTTVEAEQSEETVTAENENDILIAYFTWADNTVVTDQNAAVASALDHYQAMGDAENYGADAVSSASIIKPGNAAMMADWISQETGGTTFSIVAEEPYPSDYNECMDRASEEKAEDARPALSTHVDNFEDYETIFIGFPNWWSSLPMPVLSFVEEYDFSGKTVVPFCTHGTGGIAATVRELENALPQTATILNPIGVYRAEILQAQPKIQSWLQELGFIK